MKSQNISYIPAIDHLRAFAALLVVFFHGSYQLARKVDSPLDASGDLWIRSENIVHALLLEGYSAVALFMVMSGFIFTIGSYRKELPYRQFLRNRCLRTYPLMLAILLVALLFNPDQFNWSGLFKTVFFMANMEGSLKIAPFTGLFWAVALEWQFYLLFPFLLMGLNRFGIAFLVGLLSVAIAVRLQAAGFDVNMLELTYSTLVGRIDQFLLGMVAGVIYCRWFTASRKMDALFLLSCMLVLALAGLANKFGWFWYSGYWRFLFPTVEGLLWACFILGYLSAVRHIPDWASRITCNIGVVSYSVYLLHSIVIKVLGANHWLIAFPGMSASSQASLNTLLVVLPLVLLLSNLTYRVIELPFLQLRHRY